MPAVWGVLTSWWGNFLNWLDTSPWIILILACVAIPTYLFLFLSLRRLRQMQRPLAVLSWLGLGLPPVMLVALIAGGFGGLGRTEPWTFCILPSAVPLVVGLLVVATGGKRPLETGHGTRERAGSYWFKR